MFALLLIFPILFMSNNAEFFDKVREDRAKGAVWHKIDARKPAPKAKSLPLQDSDPETNECGEPYVIYKLKMPEE